MKIKKPFLKEFVLGSRKISTKMTGLLYFQLVLMIFFYQIEKNKINPAGQPSDYSFWNIFSSSICCYFIAMPCCAFDYKTPLTFH